MPAPLLALLAALALLLPGAAHAEERIRLFSSDVEVRRDGSLAVTETIRVVAEGNHIRRGIFRDFPTRYQRNGRTVRVGFDVEEVRRAGRAEPWDIETIDSGKRVRIGDADVLLDRGEHEYVIRYRTTRQIGFFPDYDELYWNVTGNGWIFPIEVAEARIKLPEAAPFGQRAFYAGAQGSTSQHARVIAERAGEIAFRTTAPLAPYEGLTVAVAWPKGVVAAPRPRSPASVWLQDNVPPIVAVFDLLGILAYYFLAWKKVGRGPDEGTVVPIFSPPDALSPAALRYVSDLGAFDNRTFAAALVDLGVRGRLRLVEGEKGWFTKPRTTIEKTGDVDGLPSPEAAMFAKLFATGDSVLMDDANHKIFSSARESLQTGLKRAYDGKLFLRNMHWAAAGLLLLAVAVWLAGVAIILTDPELPNRNRGLIAAIFAIGAVAATFLAGRWASRGNGLRKILGGLLAVLLGCLALLLGAAIFGIAVENGRILPMLLPLLSLPVIISSFWWMAAPTRQGRAAMDRIASFKQYLSIAEEERLETMHPPLKTPELFERYLPHAIALDVENAWARRFTSVLAASAAAGQTNAMVWYSGHSDPWNDVDGFADRIGSSLASTVSSASTAPGSSSGSGGGGFSGGGGGGGGW